MTANHYADPHQCAALPVGNLFSDIGGKQISRKL
jgi:hypothetical protein